MIKIRRYTYLRLNKYFEFRRKRNYRCVFTEIVPRAKPKLNERTYSSWNLKNSKLSPNRTHCKIAFDFRTFVSLHDDKGFDNCRDLVVYMYAFSTYRGAGDPQYNSNRIRTDEHESSVWHLCLVQLCCDDIPAFRLHHQCQSLFHHYGEYARDRCVHCVRPNRSVWS